MGHLNEHIINNNNNNNNNKSLDNQSGLKVLAIKPADVYCSLGLEKVYRH